MEWLPPGELQADSLLDLETEGNTLSVYRVEDDRSNLDRLIAALAANRDDPVNFDYALFDIGAVDELKIRAEQAQGDTPDRTVNDTWHHDLRDLTVGQLTGLARTVAGGVRDRVPRKHVIRLIRHAVAAGLLDASRMKEKLLAKIGA